MPFTRSDAETLISRRQKAAGGREIRTIDMLSTDHEDSIQEQWRGLSLGDAPFHDNRVGPQMYLERGYYLRWAIVSIPADHTVRREINESDFFESLRGRYHNTGFYYCFEFRDDAVMFKLAWGG